MALRWGAATRAGPLCKIVSTIPGILLLAVLLVGAPQSPLRLQRQRAVAGAPLQVVRRVAFFTAGLGEPYISLATRQMAATERHFCPHSPVSSHYFVFVDRDAAEQPVSNSSVTFIGKQRMGWPRDSDERYTWIHEAIREHRLQERFDFVLWMDSDNHLVADVCEDLLGTLVALRHGGDYTAEKEFPYEGNDQSQAYVPQSNRFQHPYYSAHIYGGTVANLLHLADTCAQWTLVDRAAGIQARFDDESYLQRYFMEHCPTVTLSYAFHRPEGVELPWSHTVQPLGLWIKKEAPRDLPGGDPFLNLSPTT